MGHPVWVLGAAAQAGSPVGEGQRDARAESLEPEEGAGRRGMSSERLGVPL